MITGCIWITNEPEILIYNPKRIFASTIRGENRLGLWVCQFPRIGFFSLIFFVSPNKIQIPLDQTGNRIPIWVGSIWKLRKPNC